MGEISSFLVSDRLEHLVAISDYIITSVTENLMLFFIVAAVVLTLVILLYLRLWRRAMANVRIVGAPTGRVLPKLFVPLFFMWMPAIAAGAATVWFLTLDIIWLPVTAALIAGLTIAGILIYGANIVRRPLGEQAGNDTQKHADSAEAPINFVPGNVSASSISYISFMQKTKGNALGAALVHSLRHIFRLPAKHLLMLGLAIFSVLSLGLLYKTINYLEEGPGPLAEEAAISVHIVRSPEDDRQFGGWQEYFAQAPISRATLDMVMAAAAGAGLGEDIYLEAMWQFSFVRHPLNYFMAPGRSVAGVSHIITGVSHLDIWADDVEIEFAAGFGMEDFVFAGPHAPIPVIARREMLSQENLTLGGEAVFVESFGTVETVGHARIIGVFDRAPSHGVSPFGDVRHAAVMPLEALRHKTHGHWLFESWDTGGLTYITARINLDYNSKHQLSHATEDALAQNSLGQWMGPMPLAFLAEDDGFNTAGISLEENLEILRMLFPIAISVSIAVAMGTSMLFMMQKAKYVAIMRLLGKPGGRAAFALCSEQIFVCLTGVALGPATIFVVGIHGGEAALSIAILVIAGLYFIGAVVGSVIGVVAISAKDPLELLGVGE
jgi:hypothetical protein